MAQPHALTSKGGSFRIQSPNHITCSIKNGVFDCDVVADKKLGPYPLGTVQGNLGKYKGVLLEKETGRAGLDAYYVKVSGDSLDIMLWMRHECTRGTDDFLNCSRY